MAWIKYSNFCASLEVCMRKNEKYLTNQVDASIFLPTSVLHSSSFCCPPKRWFVFLVSKMNNIYFHFYSSVADWKYRHAGLMALSAIGEGCHQQMEGILNEIVNFVLLFLQDPVSICLLIISKCFNFCSHNYLLTI